ncbi:MAG: thioredoxin [Clostridia bacterium]|nr:thioredoxin [Clostridia bacterium]
MSVVKVDKYVFENEILKSSKIVLLDFYADWCGPCRMVSPIVDKIAQEHPEYLVGKINVDDQPDLAAAFNVMSIPTLIVLKEGKAVNKIIGAASKAKILSLLQQAEG